MKPNQAVESPRSVAREPRSCTLLVLSISRFSGAGAEVQASLLDVPPERLR